MTTINEKTLKSIKAEFCAIYTCHLSPHQELKV